MYDTGYSGRNELKQITSLGTSHFIKRLFATVFSLSHSFSFTLSLPLRQHNCSSTEGFIQGFNYWTWDQFCWIFGEPSRVPGEKKKKKNGAQCVPRSKTGLGRPKITNVSFRNTCYCSQRVSIRLYTSIFFLFHPSFSFKFLFNNSSIHSLILSYRTSFPQLHCHSNLIHLS